MGGLIAPMAAVHLRQFDNSWYHPGRSLFWQAAWFFLGNPLLRWSLQPLSSVRVILLRTFGANIGTGVVIKPGVSVKYPWKLTIGNDCWIGEECWIDNLSTVRLGSDVCLSQGSYLCTGNHDWSDPSFGLIVAPIQINDGAWVGAQALLTPGVVLGECAVASAGSVVTKNIPDYEVHAGNPASFVKRRVIGRKQVLQTEDQAAV